MYLLDPRQLQSFERRLARAEPSAQHLLAQLERAAANALAMAPPAVVDKQVLPPSGDPHDYLSYAPYWWPDPSKRSGRPYIRRDGERNPESRQIGDRDGLARLISASATLGLAYHFTRRDEYAAHLVRLVRRWFLDDAAAMNPHLRYAQCIPGVSQGRSLGIIDTGLLPELLDGVELIGPSGQWTVDDQAGLTTWMRAYLRWLVESRAGKAEGSSGMNHETWYAGQVISLALFVGDEPLARRTLESVKKKIARQIEPDGRQPKELARALAWHYSAYNLTGLFNLAALGDRAGVDLWNYATSDGRSLRRALDFLVTFASGEATWTLRDINGFRPEAIHHLLRRAAIVWDEPRYRELAAQVGGGNPRVDLLMSWGEEASPLAEADRQYPRRVPNDPRAGKPADPATLVDVPALLRAYDEIVPDPTDPTQRVAFGTSGHRGSAFRGAFNEAHILAITEAICRYRELRGYDGPLFLGKDTHALSEPATRTALEVLVARGVDVRIASDELGVTPTPAVSHAIVVANRGRHVPPSDAPAGAGRGLADGIVVTPSHNPPDDGGFKYNPPNGGPADTDVTGWIQAEANRLLEASGSDGVAGIRRDANGPGRAGRHDFLGEYVGDLPDVIDLEAIRGSGLRIGVDPMGGASVRYWAAIAERHGVDITVVNDQVDPQFGFMTYDWDGKIRMDPSSPSAMAGLIARRADYDLALGNDADADRHGVVTPSAGLLNPNHVLSAAIAYLYGGGRPAWGADVGVGKTLVSSSMIDRVVADLGRRLIEVPVGFKWFVAGLVDGSLGFGGEESAGASFLTRDGDVWSTDKDGIIADLLACEQTARSRHDPGVAYRELEERFGSPVYRRVDAPATPEQKAALGKLSPSDVTTKTLAGDPITAILTRAPGNDAPIGGLKVVTDNGWFAARPSGTENVAKVYAESFRGDDHLDRLIEEAQALVASVTG